MKDNGLVWLMLMVVIATFLQTHGVNNRRTVGSSSGAEFIQALGAQLNALLSSTKGLKGLNLNLTINGLSIGTNNRSYGVNGFTETEKRQVRNYLGRPSSRMGMAHQAPISLNSRGSVERPFDTTAASYNWSQFYA